MIIETRGNDIYRGIEKIGWLVGNRVYNQKGKQLGYFTANEVYDATGHKLAFISGNFVYSGSRQMDLEEVLSGIAAVGLPDIACVAITTLL